MDSIWILYGFGITIVTLCGFCMILDDFVTCNFSKTSMDFSFGSDNTAPNAIPLWSPESQKIATYGFYMDSGWNLYGFWNMSDG